MPPSKTTAKPASIARALCRRADALSFGAPVTHVYNPLVYARTSVETYLERYAKRGVEVVLLGMNPGPWGMAQTGVPFGEVGLVRDWLGIDTPIGKPKLEHPKRPIEGFACKRSEVSGRRLWGWARERFGSPQRFFARFFVWNYCPLVFMEDSGRNHTPDKLPAGEREPLFGACDDSLGAMLDWLDPGLVVGVGKFAETRARAVLNGARPVGTVLHPSPASPLANKGWAPRAEAQLADLGVELPA